MTRVFEYGDAHASLWQRLVADITGATDKLDCLVGKESTRQDTLWTRFLPTDITFFFNGLLLTKNRHDCMLFIIS